ncbi:hypothetical protein [Egicoccus sp. AB-alg2]|uniref:hypothetical protein n=1 Tax=Egicoccus sp. AB-alg2 TaxID=3242693 RepID=UPI00359EB29E
MMLLSPSPSAAAAVEARPESPLTWSGLAGLVAEAGESTAPALRRLVDTLEHELDCELPDSASDPVVVLVRRFARAHARARATCTPLPHHDDVLGAALRLQAA